MSGNDTLNRGDIDIFSDMPLVKSIFPTFNVNVPMPGDTAVPGSFGNKAAKTDSGSSKDDERDNIPR
jgi:hypothetical protein